MNWRILPLSHFHVLWRIGFVLAVLAFASPSFGAGGKAHALPGESRGGASEALGQASEKHWPHERSDLAPDPQTIFGRLDNGFRYVILPNAKPKGRTRLHLVVEAGSLHETEAQRGIAHFLEHMLFNGSTHFPPGELVRYFQKIGMQFGPDANARTGFYDTVYDINLPTNDRQSLAEALLVMQDYAEGALLLPSEIERERGIVLAEKRDRDSADYRAYVASLKFELAGTRFPDRLPIGTEAVIRDAGREVFAAFYDRWYRPNNMILVMVGDVDPAVGRALIEDHFAGMEARAPAPALPSLGTLTHEGVKPFYHYESELGTTSVTLQVLAQATPPRDDAAFRREQIEAYLAHQILRHRLDRKLNQPESPLTDTGAGSGIYLRQIRYGYITADCEPENWERALASIEQELRQALAFGFDESERDRVVKDYGAALDKAAAQANTRDSAVLARELIYSVTNDRVFRSPDQEKAFAAPILDAVTTEDLRDRLRTVWHPEHRLVLVTGNVRIAPSSGTPEDVIAAAFDRTRKTTVSRPVRRQPASFPYLPPPPREGDIATQQKIDAVDVAMVRFANGVHLNFKPTSFTEKEVQFVLSFGEGRAGVPPDKPALAALAEGVVNESGLGRLDKEALAQALAGKKTRIRFAVQDDRFVLEGRSVPEEMELVMQLLQAYIVDPAFRESAWNLALGRYRQTYRALRRSVDGVMDLYGWRFLGGGDPRFGLPPLEALEGLSADDVKQWVAPALRRGPMELAVVGDVDRDTVVRLAARYLGGLQDNRMAGTAVTGRPGPDFPEARRMDVPVRSRVDKALLVMALPTDDIWDIARTRRLNILAEIISERLRLRVREKMAAAYSTGAYSWPSRTYPGYGVLVIHTPLATEMVDRVQIEVEDILNQIRRHGVTRDELQRALEPTLAGIRDRFRENGYWLHTVLVGASRHPVQIDWSQSILDDYAAVTKAEIDAVARAYLDTGKLAIIRARSVDEE